MTFGPQEIATGFGALVGAFCAQSLGILQIKALIRAELNPLKQRVAKIELAMKEELLRKTPSGGFRR